MRFKFWKRKKRREITDDEVVLLSFRIMYILQKRGRELMNKSKKS